MEYRDLVSSAVIYDDVPAIMYLRFVNDRMVAGVMESKEFGKTGKFYFYLVRWSSPAQSVLDVKDGSRHNGVLFGWLSWGVIIVELHGIRIYSYVL